MDVSCSALHSMGVSTAISTTYRVSGKMGEREFIGFSFLVDDGIENRRTTHHNPFGRFFSSASITAQHIVEALRSECVYHYLSF
jgi:hypothetical protein